jgi:hypothetical protein
MNTETAHVLKQRWIGVKVATVGVALGAVGMFVGFALGHPISLLLILVGCAVGMVGGVLHFQQMRRESRLDPKELHSKAKQPWER